MMKKIFKSAVPGSVTLCLGVLTFIIGNFFGEFLPKSWLVPLAILSSIALCSGVLLLAVNRAIISARYSFSNEVVAAIDKASQIVIVCGMILVCIWVILMVLGAIDYNFVIKNIYVYSTYGLFALGSFCLGVIWTIDEFKSYGILKTSNWQRCRSVIFYLFYVVLGVLMWVYKLDIVNWLERQVAELNV